MTVYGKPFRAFAWGLVGVITLGVVADFLGGGTLRALSGWLIETPLTATLTETFGVPFGLGEIDAFEARDYLLIGLYGAVGLPLLVYAFRELVVRRAYLSTDTDGVTLRLSGWFGRPSVIPWKDLEDARTGTVTIWDLESPALLLELRSRDSVPIDPWGARWLDRDTLAVSARHWATPPDEVAKKLADLAVRNLTVLPPI